MKQTFISELIARVKKQNPKFFKKLQIGAFIVGGIAAGVGYVVGHGAVIPDWVVSVSQEVAKACGLIIPLAQIPNADATETETPKP